MWGQPPSAVRRAKLDAPFVSFQIMVRRPFHWNIEQRRPIFPGVWLSQTNWATIWSQGIP